MAMTVNFITFHLIRAAMALFRMFHGFSVVMASMALRKVGWLARARFCVSFHPIIDAPAVNQRVPVFRSPRLGAYAGFGPA